MKDKFGSGFSIDFKTINYAKTFGFECSVAVYLLGLTLGYDKTYDAYYDFVKLPIFELRTENQEANKLDYVQESNEKEICSENRNENVAVSLSSEDTIKGKDISTTDTNFPTIEQETSLVQQGQLFVMESVNKKQPIAWLRLKNKNDNDFKPAFNDKEVSTLISKGYKIAKRFSKEKSRISFHKVTKFHDSFIFKISTRGLQAVLVCPKQTCYPLVGIVYNPMPLPFLYGSTVLLMDENSLLNCSLNHSPISAHLWQVQVWTCLLGLSPLENLLFQF